jgi:hypothetical protein
MRHTKTINNVHHRSKLADLMTASPMSAEIHAAVQRRRTEIRRMIEDMRVTAQANSDAYGRN